MSRINGCVCGQGNLQVTPLYGVGGRHYVLGCSACLAQTPPAASEAHACAIWAAMQTAARPVAEGDMLRVHVPLVVGGSGGRPRVWPVPAWAAGGALCGLSSYARDWRIAREYAGTMSDRDHTSLYAPIMLRATVRAPLINQEVEDVEEDAG